MRFRADVIAFLWSQRAENRPAGLLGHLRPEEIRHAGLAHPVVQIQYVAAAHQSLERFGSFG
jgi:hypothetical protein